MLQEAIEVFRMMMKENGERFVIDAHIPKEGVYRLIIMKENTWEIKQAVDIRPDSKNDEMNMHSNVDYKLIQELDYKSKLLNMNKRVDPKKIIHSNNYLSLAVKKENIISGKLSKEIIHQYYEILRNPSKKYKKKSQDKILYQKIEEKLGPPDIEIINKIEKFVLENDIWEGINFDKIEKKDYVKIFFVYPDEKRTKDIYWKESQRYLIPRIYNKNEYNIDCKEGTIGLPDDNMQMNKDKPYLKNKTRKVTVPYLLNQEDALLQSKFFDYLLGQVSKKKIHIYIDNIKMEIHSYSNKERPKNIVSGYYLRCRSGKKGAEICEADVITHYNSKLDKPFYLKNYIEIPEKILEKSKIQYEEAIENQWEILDLMNAILFEGKLRSNFFTDSKDINIYDACLKQSILKSRDVFINWFWKGEKNQIVRMIDDISLSLIKNSICKQETFAAQRQFNLRWSLLEYLDDQPIGGYMSKIRKQLREHINATNNVEWDFTSDAEYCYAVGQAVSYLLSLSRANNKAESYVNPFLNAKNAMVINRRLEQMYKKYNYQIMHVNGGRASQLLAHVLEYEPKKIETEKIMAGFVATSLIYEKRNDNEDEE